MHRSLMLVLTLASPLLLSLPQGLKSSSAMAEPRAAHQQALLPDGRVLVIAGCVVDGCDEGLSNSTEVYDPNTGQFTQGPDLQVPRAGHVAVRLQDGRILVFGGWSGTDATDQVEAWDPRAKTFEAAGTLQMKRDGFTATLLQDGTVLITGGYHGNMRRLNSAEVYDPKTQTSTLVGALHSPRMSHAANLLQDGRVLVTGGSRDRGEVLGSAEVYDPTTKMFLSVENLRALRHKHAAVTLQDGRVLILGGSGSTEDREQWRSTEIFNPQTLKFEAGPNMHEGRYKFTDAVSLLPDGRVLVSGSGRQAEVYLPKSNTFEVMHGPEMDLSYTVSTVLPGGQVLVTGGYDERIQIQRSSWLYPEP